MSVEYRGEKFAGYNKPKRTPNHPKKSHVVLAKEGSTIKMIRFGEQGASTAGKPKAGESDRMKKKRAKHDMVKTLLVVSLVLRTGQIKQNGKGDVSYG